MPGLGLNDIWRRPATQEAIKRSTTPEVAAPESQAPAASRPKAVFEFGDGAQVPTAIQLMPPAVRPSASVSAIPVMPEALRKVPMAGLGPEVAALHDRHPELVMWRALNLESPIANLVERDLLVYRGAALASLAASTGTLAGGQGLGCAREQVDTVKRQLERFGTTASKADAQALDMLEYDLASVFGVAPADLPREVHGGKKGHIALDSDYYELEARRERLLNFVEGVAWSLNSRTPQGMSSEAGYAPFKTALDTITERRELARQTAKIPGIRAHLVMDEATLDAVMKLRSNLDARGWDAAREYSRVGVPTLADSLQGKGLTKAYSDAIAVSASQSGASPLEAAHTRDMVLALGGDPLLVTHMARGMADLALGDNPKALAYKQAAKEFYATPDFQHLQEFAVAVATVGEIDLDWLSAQGFGPGSVLASVLGGKPTNVEQGDADALFSALPEDPAFSASANRGHAPQNFLMPATSPKEQPKGVQITPDGEKVRVVAFVKGEPSVVYSGPTSEAATAGAVNATFAEWAKVMGSALTTPHAIMEAHAMGLLSVAPKKAFPKSPFFVDPRRQAPLQEIVHFEDPMTLEDIERVHHRDMVTVGAPKIGGREFGGLL